MKTIFIFIMAICVEFLLQPNQLNASELTPGEIIKLYPEDVEFHARNGNDYAIKHAARSFLYGINGFPKNYSKSLFWSNKLMNYSAIDSYSYLAEIYGKGLGVEKNIDLAKKYLFKVKSSYKFRSTDLKSKEIEKLYLDGLVYVYSLHIFGKSFNEFNEIVNKANDGVDNAQENLASAYFQILDNAKLNFRNEKILELSENEENKYKQELKYWLERLSNQGNSYGLYTLGNLYVDGLFIDVNFFKGEDLLIKVAKKCDSYMKKAVYKLGNIYGLDGKFKNYKESYKWYNIYVYKTGVSWLNDTIKELEERMTPDQIFDSQNESREWFKKYCN